jgi:hypothetical protein
MGHFIGQLKNDEGFNKIFNRASELTQIKRDNEVFFNTDIDFAESVDYSTVRPDHKLESEKYYFLDYSQGGQNILDSIQIYFNTLDSTAEISTLTKDHLDKIELLIYGKKTSNKYKLNIQAITPKYFIKSKNYLKVINSHIEYKHEKDVLEFKDQIDIFIDENEKKIYFKHFANLKKIDNSFIELYQEASDEEQETFIEEVNSHENFEIDSSKLKLQTTNLKKLKYALDNGMVSEVLSKKRKVNQYIRRYKDELSLRKSEGMYVLKTNKDITSLLKVIFENFYQGEITGKKLESNSSKEL